MDKFNLIDETSLEEVTHFADEHVTIRCLSSVPMDLEDLLDELDAEQVQG